MTNQSDILRRWQLISPYLSRQQQTLWAAAEAEVMGRGGGLMVASITGIAPQIISIRKRSLKLTRMALAGSLIPINRRCAARRKLTEANDAKIEPSLQLVLAEEVARNPTGRKKCVRGGFKRLSRRLAEHGHRVSPNKVAKLLRKLGYSLKKNAGRKLTEVKDPEIESAIQKMLSEEIAGDPMGRQRWIRSSLSFETLG